MRDTHNLGPFVVLAVFLQNETVGREGRHGVEEGEDSDGDEELSRGGVVPDQEGALAVPPFTGGGIEVHLMEPGNKEKRPGVIVSCRFYGGSDEDRRKRSETPKRERRYLKGYSNLTSIPRSLSDRFLHSTLILNMPE